MYCAQGGKFIPSIKVSTVIYYYTLLLTFSNVPTERVVAKIVD